MTSDSIIEHRHFDPSLRYIICACSECVECYIFKKITIRNEEHASLPFKSHKCNSGMILNFVLSSEGIYLFLIVSRVNVWFDKVNCVSCYDQLIGYKGYV